MRLVSLLASATEMVAELGALEQLVGRSHECDYPPAVLSLPVVSTLAIDTTASSGEIDAQITGLRPRIVTLTPHRLDDVWEDVLRVGEAIDRAEQARQRVYTYQQRLEQLRTRCDRLAGPQRPRVAVLEWLDPLMGAGNWTPELVTYAGGEPLFGEIGQHTPWLSWEELQDRKSVV